MAKRPGSIWIEGFNLHYIDQFNREWMLAGVIVHSSASGVVPGSIWIDPNNSFLYYISEDGTSLCRPPLIGDAAVPGTATPGSIWIGTDNLLHWLTPHIGTQRLNVRAHNDVAQIAEHTDTHTDTPHSDSPHTDTAHTDQTGSSTHTDQHSDTPHADHTDNVHGDFNDEGSGQTHQDFGDQIYYYYPPPPWVFENGLFWYHDDYYSPGGTFHSDFRTASNHGDTAIYNTQHYDFTNHTDVPHGDSPHVDTHSDSPHQDRASSSGHADHTDTVPHVDTPHVDTPHGDGHTDTHADTHGDVAHSDEPFYVGP